MLFWQNFTCCTTQVLHAWRRHFKQISKITWLLLCGEPAISLHSHTVPLVQWSPFASRHEGPWLNPQGGILMWNRDSPVSVVSLHWWPRCDWSLWHCLRRASSRTVTRPLCRQCNYHTLSHTALLSQFHARCRSSFQLHNWHSWLLGEPCGEPAI